MRYEAPNSIELAIGLLAGERGQAFLLAGGTDLLVRLRSGFIEPDLIVDVKGIDRLNTITSENGGFRIGAAVSAAKLGEHKDVRKLWPGVVEAVELIGSKQVQGRATMVGNMCNASPAADSVPAMVAAGATVAIAGPKGSRTVPVEELATGPGKTILGKGELVEFDFSPGPAAQFGRCLSAVHSAERNGHRRRRCGGQPHARQVRCVQRGARVARRGGGAGVARRRCRQSDHRHQGRRSGTGAIGRGGVGRLPPHRRQAGNQGIQDQGCRRACTARRTDSAGTGEEKIMSQVRVSTTINGDTVEYLCDAEETLLDVLRNRLGLTGSKEGCGSGDCGACSVMIDNRLVCSCLVLGAEAQGKKIETIEGMAHGEALHPLQRNFIEHAALQCGICTPGFLIAAKALLERNPNPSETEVRFWLAGNLCRCTGYDKIVRAVMATAAEMRQAKA